MHRQRNDEEQVCDDLEIDSREVNLTEKRGESQRNSFDFSQINQVEDFDSFSHSSDQDLSNYYLCDLIARRDFCYPNWSVISVIRNKEWSSSEFSLRTWCCQHQNETGSWEILKKNSWRDSNHLIRSTDLRGGVFVLFRRRKTDWKTSLSFRFIAWSTKSKEF